MVETIHYERKLKKGLLQSQFMVTVETWTMLSFMLLHTNKKHNYTYYFWPQIPHTGPQKKLK